MLKERGYLTVELAEKIRNGKRVERIAPLVAKGSYTNGCIFTVRYTGEHRTRVLKIVGDRIEGFNRETAERLQRDAALYHEGHKRLGIPVPQTKFFTREFDGKVVLVELADYHGESLEQRLVSNPRLLNDYLGQVLQKVIMPLLEASPDGTFVENIGFDAVLRNLCFIRSMPGSIDFVPARFFRGPTDYTIDIPEPTDPVARRIGFTRYYTLPGILLRLFLSTVQIFPEGYDSVMAQMARFLARRQRSEAFEQLSTVCATIWIEDVVQAQVALDNLSIDNYFELRHLGCWLTSRNLALKPELTKLFKITSFTGDRYLSESEFEAARAHVRLMLERCH